MKTASNTLFDLLLVGAILVSLFATVGGCAHAKPVPVVPPAQVRVVSRECVAREPPSRGAWGFPIEGGICPAGYVCMTKADALALANEVEARRLWDATVVCASE